MGGVANDFPQSLTDGELLAKLIGFDTTSCRSNRAAVDFICEYLDRPGIELIRNESEDRAKTNLIAIAGPPADASRNGLILSGHLDTVPATEPEWTSDPFTLTERDGAYFGRGTADMKGFDALAINALRAAQPDSLSAPLVLMLTYDEELGSLGAKRLVEIWPSDRVLPRHAIIGEPTSLGVVRMHKGHLKMRITIKGKAAHSGSPELGVNAIEPMWELLCGLAEMRKYLESKRTSTSRFFPKVPHSVLTVARIAGGESLNVIPETCTVEIGLRLLPGEHSEASIAMVNGIARGIATGGGLTVATTVINNNPPMLTDEDSHIHRKLCAMVNQSDSRGVSFASDAGWLSTLGIECVLFGPGTIEVAHMPNESLPIEEFHRAKTILMKLIEELR